MPFAVELVVSALIVLGSIFLLVGTWGLVRLPDLPTRLHAPTKAGTLGVGACLAASSIWFTARTGTWSANELLIVLFLFLTAPVGANMIAKAWMHMASARSPEKVEGEPDPGLGVPPTGRAGGWATFDAAPELEAVLVKARRRSRDTPTRNTPPSP